MPHRSQHRKWLSSAVVIVLVLTIATPVLADYIGPNRTVTETTTVCKVILNECQFVTAKDQWQYKNVDSWSCSNESKPWQAYSSNSRPCNDTLHTDGYQYWSREDVTQTRTNTYPPATISSFLQNCTTRNGWCITAPQLLLTGLEPVTGYSIIAIEAIRNGQTFACTGANCSVPLNQGNNNFSYWALSSFLDSSEMGSFTAKVDSQLPNIAATLSGTAGLNGWYLGPVTFNSTATDATSGLASFTCTLDGAPPGSCNTINVNSEGLHTVVLTARDNAGHVHTLTRNTSIDIQNPSLSASLNGTLGSNDWYTAATLNASAADPAPGSGLSILEYSFDGGGWGTFPASGVLDLTDGQHTVDLRAQDKAGRMVTSSKSFSLDTAPPSLITDSAGTLGLNDWHITNPSLTASANDDTSGLDFLEYSLDNGAWTPYTGALSLGEGIHSISFWAQDQAGWVTQVDRTYHVDTRAPQIAGSLGGSLGTNDWYISEVMISASASDPVPGSDVDTFTYILNGGAETPYTGPLTLSDGRHTVQLIARDKAGLSYSIEQIFSVDTISPSLTIDSAIPTWVRGSITINGTAGDDGSGLSSVEISNDGGQSWQSVTDTNSWTYNWNTSESPNGSHTISLRAADLAGLATEQAVNVSVDNLSPEITLPNSWLQWDTVTLNASDEHSGLSEVRVEISDPQGRWPTRLIQLDPAQFPLAFKWDRRFGDDTIAEAGTYAVKVFASDKVGNTQEKSASIHVLLDILPPGPTATLQSFTPTTTSVTSAPTSTIISSPTVTPVYTATSISSSTTPQRTATSSPISTQNVIVRVFGTLQPTAQTTPTSAASPTSRAAPTQVSAVDWLQSIFEPPTTEATITEIGVQDETEEAPQPTNSSVLWGTAAAAAVGAATAYAQEEKRKREEEKARQEALEAAQEERREKMKARKIEKMEAKRAQEARWEQARLELEQQREEAIDAATYARMDKKMDHYEAQEEAKWTASQEIIRQREINNKKTEEEKEKAKELQAALVASSAASRAQREAIQEPPKSESNWWEKTKSFVSENIIQPVNTHIYQPIVKPALATIAETTTNAINWLDKNVYQPHIAPAIEKNKQLITSELGWINKNIIEPYVKPVVAKVSEAAATSVAWVNEKVYQPYIKPAIEKTVKHVSEDLKWLNQKIYQPYIQPAVEVIKEKVYQPYIQPVVAKVNEVITEAAAWTNENIYTPYLEPIVSDINQHIYQPLVNEASNWWDEYGEWVHGALDAAGFIPGLGEIADGLNGLIYLGEGRYLEASIAAMAMIPLVGDLGKAGKWTLKAGQAVAETVVEKVAKELVEEAIEKVAKEAGEELTEKAAKETLEEGVEKLVKETSEEIAEEVSEKTLKETSENFVEETSQVVIDKTKKKISDEVSTVAPKDTLIDNAAEEVTEQIDKTQLIDTFRQQYGEEALDLIQRYDDNGVALLQQYGNEAIDFVKRAEKLGVDPTSVLYSNPKPGQTLEGWLLKISDPNSPVNMQNNLKLSDNQVSNLLEQSLQNPESDEFVIGYFDPNEANGYVEVADKRNATHLSMPQSLYNNVGFQDGTGDFWPVNRGAIQYGIDQRKTFVLSTDLQTILSNPGKFTYAEIKMIMHPGSNYIHVFKDGYDMLVPAEKLIP